MSNYVVTVLDTTGIQPYIFNSNRLRENIGASYLVAQSTDGWVKDTLKKMGVAQPHAPIESSGQLAELVYAGGGNAMLIFRSHSEAQEFTQKLSRRILKKAPGLNLVAAHKEFDWDESLYDVVQDLIENELDRQKRARIPSAPLLGLGVTATCQSTQLPAVGVSDRYVDADEQDKYFISRETEAKLIAAKHSNIKLKEQFGAYFDGKVDDFAYRMDYLGRSRDENSYFAVVHADGNSMGDRFKAHGQKGRELNPEHPNRGYIEAMRNLSESVNQAGLKAVRTVVKTLVASIDSEGKIAGKFPLFEKDGKKYLPFRPLIYGGDDVTFVCDGRLGLELASIYLQSLQEQPVADDKVLTACAGVCIVKSHYPFARAYDLSEALCASGKTFLREGKSQWDDEKLSAIDWHFAASGLSGTIGEIRQREYRVTDGDLTMRPVLIQEEDGQWRTWSNFTRLVRAFNEDDDWKGRRNKAIALREKLRQGKEATREFLKAYRLEKLPEIAGGGDAGALKTTGWTEERCGYFDAIEAMEFYLPLK